METAKAKREAGSSMESRAFEIICDHVREKIASGELKAGDKLPAERNMAEEFQVGRNVVREAIRSLEVAGILRLEKGRAGGAYIRPGNATRLTLALRDLFQFGSVGLSELMEARTQIVATVTRLAVERASDSDLDKLEGIIEETEELTRMGELEKRVERNGEFYVTLALVANNRALALIITSTNEILRKFIYAAQVGPDQPDMLIPSRRRFLRHLRARDADRAVAEMVSQNLDLYRRVEASLDANSIHRVEKSKKKTKSS